MEIKEGTLVAILPDGIADFPFGVVVSILNSSKTPDYLVRTKSGEEAELLKRNLFPLCQGVSQTTEFDMLEIATKLPEMLRNFALQIRILEDQIAWLTENKAMKQML